MTPEHERRITKLVFKKQFELIGKKIAYQIDKEKLDWHDAGCFMSNLMTNGGMIASFTIAAAEALDLENEVGELNHKAYLKMKANQRG